MLHQHAKSILTVYSGTHNSVTNFKYNVSFKRKRYGGSPGSTLSKSGHRQHTTSRRPPAIILIRQQKPSCHQSFSLSLLMNMFGCASSSQTGQSHCNPSNCLYKLFDGWWKRASQGLSKSGNTGKDVPHHFSFCSILLLETILSDSPINTRSNRSS